MDDNLTEEEKRLLTHCLEKHNPELLTELNDLYAEKLDEDIVNEMRFTIGIELASKGFEKNNEPIEYGLKLEDLIDKLARLYWK